MLTSPSSRSGSRPSATTRSQILPTVSQSTRALRVLGVLSVLAAKNATKTDKTTITRISRVDWDTVGRICERVVADGLDPERLDGLVNIGVDEVSWRRHHHYLTLVADHDTKKIIWGAPGKDTATLDAFFDDLGPDRAEQIEAVSMDMGAAFNKSVRAHVHADRLDLFGAVGSEVVEE